MSDDLSRMWKKAVATELEARQEGLEEVRKSAETPHRGRCPGSPEILPGSAADIVHALSISPVRDTRLFYLIVHFVVTLIFGE